MTQGLPTGQRAVGTRSRFGTSPGPVVSECLPRLHRLSPTVTPPVSHWKQQLSARPIGPRPLDTSPLRRHGRSVVHECMTAARHEKIGSQNPHSLNIATPVDCPAHFLMSYLLPKAMLYSCSRKSGFTGLASNPLYSNWMSGSIKSVTISTHSQSHLVEWIFYLGQ